MRVNKARLIGKWSRRVHLPGGIGESKSFRAVDHWDRERERHQWVAEVCMQRLFHVAFISARVSPPSRRRGARVDVCVCCKTCSVCVCVENREIPTAVCVVEGYIALFFLAWHRVTILSTGNKFFRPLVKRKKIFYLKLSELSLSLSLSIWLSSLRVPRDQCSTTDKVSSDDPKWLGKKKTLQEKLIIGIVCDECFDWNFFFFLIFAR